MATDQRVVIASADPIWTELEPALGDAGFVTTVVEPAAAAAAISAIAAGAVTCIVVDVGAAAVAPVRDVRRRTTAPIVVVCDAGDAAIERELLDAGATDWLAPGDRTAAEVARRLRCVVRGASRVRDDVLAIVAHDLRAPLRSIRIACSELADDLPFEVAARYIGAIER